jgi:hypothetical protein
MTQLARHAVGPQLYVPHERVEGLQVPLPSHVDTVLSTLETHDAAPHATVVVANLHTFASVPSQRRPHCGCVGELLHAGWPMSG